MIVHLVQRNQPIIICNDDDDEHDLDNYDAE